MATFRATFQESTRLNATFQESERLSANFGEIQKVMTGNCEELSHKPAINGITLIGDQDSPTLKLQGKMDTLTVQEIERILYVG